MPKPFAETMSPSAFASRRRIVKAAALLCMALSWGCEEEPKETKASMDDSTSRSRSTDIPVSSVVDGLNDLTFRLYAAIPPGDGGNLFLSPYSVSQAIAPLALGARGETAAQIRAFVGAGTVDAGTVDAGDDGAGPAGATADDEAWHAANRELAKRVQAIPEDDPTTFRIANRIWHEKTLAWEASFRDALQRHYDSGAEAADFRGNAGGERIAINEWIADQTEQKIPDLLPEGSLTADTRLVLANAIYLLGEWKDAFDPAKTKPLPFFTSPADSVDTPFLVRTGRYRVADLDHTWLLELPYDGDKFSMVVLLPADRDGLDSLENGLTLDDFEAWTAKLVEREVDVLFPKFEMRTKASLEKPLAGMGLSLPFDAAAADFSGISTAEPLWVDRVFHEAFVRVDEKGTEAAAATATTVRTLSMPEPNPVFRADHPFLFVIRENETGLVLFVGRVGNPAAGA